MNPDTWRKGRFLLEECPHKNVSSIDKITQSHPVFWIQTFWDSSIFTLQSGLVGFFVWQLTSLFKRISVNEAKGLITWLNCSVVYLGRRHFTLLETETAISFSATLHRTRATWEGVGRGWKANTCKREETKGVRGHVLPMKFDLNTSRMSGNAFKITSYV